MSSTDAAVEVLARLGPSSPLRTEQILDAIWRGGVRLGGRSPLQSLYRSLFRNKKFEKVGVSLWGLRSWRDPATANHLGAADANAEPGLSASDEESLEEATGTNGGGRK